MTTCPFQFSHTHNGDDTLRVSGPGRLPGSISKSLIIRAFTNSFIHSIGMCRMRRFLAVLSSFFHSSLLCTLSFHPFPPTSLPSFITSSCHLFLGLPISLVVSSPHANRTSNLITSWDCFMRYAVFINQCSSTFVKPRPGKFFFHKTRARSQQIYS